MQKALLKNLAILTGKQLWWSIFFNKVANLQACSFIKKATQHRCAAASITKFKRILTGKKHNQTPALTKSINMDICTNMDIWLVNISNQEVLKLKKIFKKIKLLLA